MSVPAKYGVASDVLIDIIKARRRIINLFHKLYLFAEIYLGFLQVSL